MTADADVIFAGLFVTAGAVLRVSGFSFVAPVAVAVCEASAWCFVIVLLRSYNNAYIIFYYTTLLADTIKQFYLRAALSYV